jgi:hypothetical protein
MIQPSRQVVWRPDPWPMDRRRYAPASHADALRPHVARRRTAPRRAAERSAPRCILAISERYLKPALHRVTFAHDAARPGLWLQAGFQCVNAWRHRTGAGLIDLTRECLGPESYVPCRAWTTSHGGRGRAGPGLAAGAGPDAGNLASTLGRPSVYILPASLARSKKWLAVGKMARPEKRAAHTCSLAQCSQASRKTILDSRSPIR